LMEAAFVGSDYGPYKHIDHGIDGMLARKEKDWVISLSSLIESEKLRNKLVKNATKYVEANHMLDKHLHRWKQLLIS